MYRYNVINNQSLTPTTLLLTLRRSAGTKPLNFKPGQYTAISFKRKGRHTPVRCFSIINSPTDKDIIQCSIKRKGRFTEALTELRPGDVVNVVGVFGGFIFDPDYDHNMVLIAGGIGIAPFMSMIQYATNKKLSNKITLIYGIKNQNDVPFLGQLIELEKRNPNFKMIIAVGNGPTDKFANYRVNNGRITPKIIDEVVAGTYGHKSFFICGPPVFMGAMTNVLYDKGVSEDRIMTEEFGQGSIRKKIDTYRWPLNVYTFGAIGVVLATATVMASDLLTNLPVYSLFNSSSTMDLNPTNSRQNELDRLVNGLPAKNNGAPSSSTVTSASTASGGSSSTQISNNSSGQTAVSAAQTTANTPISTAKQPVCTTSQSGVTTCV